MGFRKPDLTDAYSAIRSALLEINSPYNDGFTSMLLKKELYNLKCWLEDQYDETPKFSEEDKWEQERIVDILRK